jgi:hypothetical protein
VVGLTGGREDRRVLDRNATEHPSDQFVGLSREQPAQGGLLHVVALQIAVGEELGHGPIV